MRSSLISRLRRDLSAFGQRRRKRPHSQKYRPALLPLEERQMLSIAQLNIQDATVVEGDAGTTNMVLDIVLSAPAEQVVSVGFATVGTSPIVTAKSPADFQAAAGAVTFTPGETLRQITVAVEGDLLNESNEFFYVNLRNPNGAEIFKNRAVATIVDNDALPSVSVNDVTVKEGNKGAVEAVFTVTLSRVSGQPVTVNYRAVDGTAQAGADFEPALGAVVIERGQTREMITVSVSGDLRDEDAETFSLDLTGAGAATLADARGAGTIKDDDIQYIVTGADAGGGPHVRVLDPLTGEQRFDFYAYDPAFTGGVRVATADVNRDGVPDIITGAGHGGGPHVKVFDGATRSQLAGLVGNFYAYDARFTGGVHVAAGDLDGDGYADIVTGACVGGGPHVRAFSGRDGSLLTEFYAFDAGFAGGVRVAVADMDGDLRAEIIAAAGPGGGPHVRIFNAQGQQIAGPLGTFYAYHERFTGGLYVAAGDINGDGYVDIITGAGHGGGPHVRVFSAVTTSPTTRSLHGGPNAPYELASFYAFGSSFGG
jgi:hypothetical protein